MSAQCRHGLIRYECWQCRDESKQSTHVAHVFAGGLVTAVQQLEERDAELARLRADLAAARAEIARLQDDNRGLRAEFDSELAAAKRALKDKP